MIICFFFGHRFFKMEYGLPTVYFKNCLRCGKHIKETIK